MVFCEIYECIEDATYGTKRQRASRCKEHRINYMVTSPKRYCKHYKRRDNCKECKGSYICDHNKRKSVCK